MATLPPVHAVSAGLTRRLRSTRSLVLGYVLGYLTLAGVLVLGQSSPLRAAALVTHLDADIAGPFWVDKFARWDSDWYLGIATEGYHYIPGQQSPVAFFPAYPMVVRAMAAVVGNAAVAAHLVSLACGLLAIACFRRWARMRLSPGAARYAVWGLVLYPFGVYLYGMVYGDALFLAAAVGAFVLLERDHLLAAGVLGAVATGCRPVGIAVTVGLLLRTVERRAQTGESMAPGSGASRPGPLSLRALARAVPRLRGRDLLPAVSIGGLGAWMTYLWVSFGDPLAFVRVEGAPGWDQGVGPSTWLKHQYVEALRDGSSAAPILTVNAIAAGLVVALVPLVRRRLGWGYAAYTAVVIAIPLLGTSSFIGCGRYALAAFPAFAAGGLWLADRSRPARRAILALSAGGLLVVTYAVGMGVLAS